MTHGRVIGTGRRGGGQRDGNGTVSVGNRHGCRAALVEGQQRKHKGQDDDTHPHGILLLHPKCYLDNMVPY